MTVKSINSLIIDAAQKYLAQSELLVESNVTDITGADRVTNIVSLTQAEYDAITPDASTFYIITD